MHQHRHNDGPYRRIELITGTSRRRRSTSAEKAALVAESLRPGVSVSDLARRAEVNRGFLQTWHRTAMREAAERGEVFVPLRLQDGAPVLPRPTADGTAGQAAPAAIAVIEIESGTLRVRFNGPVDTGALRLVLGHFERAA